MEAESAGLWLLSSSHTDSEARCEYSGFAARVARRTGDMQGRAYLLGLLVGPTCWEGSSDRLGTCRFPWLCFRRIRRIASLESRLPRHQRHPLAFGGKASYRVYPRSQ